MKKEIRLTLWIVFVLVCFIFAYLSIGNLLDKISCQQKAELLKVGFSHSFWTGCFFNGGGGWFPEANWFIK